MAKLVTKFKYLKPNRKMSIGGYAKYFITPSLSLSTFLVYIHSFTKVMQSYSSIVQYIDTSEKIWTPGQPCIYKGASISPGGESERAY